MSFDSRSSGNQPPGRGAEAGTADSPDLPACPWCDYSLRGLPPEGVCPECGHPYDRLTRVWRSRPWWHSFMLWFGLVAYTLVTAPLLLLRHSMPLSRPRLIALLTLLQVLPWLALAVGIWWRSGGRSLTAITVEGVLVRERDRKPRLTAWSSNLELDPPIDEVGSGLTLCRNGYSVKQLTEFFRTVEQRRAFRAAFTAAKRVHAPQERAARIGKPN